jgi:hypothetical protein
MGLYPQTLPGNAEPDDWDRFFCFGVIHTGAIVTIRSMAVSRPMTTTTGPP